MRGFTLLELLVVVVIIAILLSVGMLSLRSGERAAVQWAGQAQRWIEALCDQAIFRQQPFGWRLDEGRLQAYRMQVPAHQPTAEETAPATRALQLAALVAEAETEALRRWTVWPDHAPLTWAPPVAVLPETETWPADAPLPGLWRCWPTGAYTPGAFIVEEVSDGQRWYLKWDAWGRFRLMAMDAREE